MHVIPISPRPGEIRPDIETHAHFGDYRYRNQHLHDGNPQMYAKMSRYSALLGVSALHFSNAAPFAAFTAPPSIVYDFYSQHCPPLPQPGCARDIDIGCDADIADAPLRAWFNGTTVNVLASLDLGSRGFVGAMANNVQHSCRIYANSTNNMDISMYANHEWIHSSWYFAGNNSIYALTHNEYHCDRPGCPVWPNPGDLFMITGVTLMQSLDGGESWQHSRPPPLHSVAVPPYAWNTTLGSIARLGFRSPSSIVYNSADGYYYASVTAGWGYDALLQQAGACMMRSRDVTDPSSWLAWDGSAFTVSLSTSAWQDPTIDPARHVCIPFTNTTYGSLLFSTLYNQWMYFGTVNGDDDGGWQFALSADLAHWSAWTRVQGADTYLPLTGRVIPPPAGTPLPGRFIKRQDPNDPSVWWEDPSGTFKRPVGSCTPCANVSACGSNLTPVPDSTFYSLANETAFGCVDIGYNATGVSHYYYPTLVDPSAASLHPNFDVVGTDAILFLVRQRCVNAVYGGDGVGMLCDPFDKDGLLVRDIVQVPLHFSSV